MTYRCRILTMAFSCYILTMAYNCHILSFYAPPWRSILFSSCPFATEVVVSVRNGSQLTGVPWELRLAGHTSATHTFLVVVILGGVGYCILVYYRAPPKKAFPLHNIEALSRAWHSYRSISKTHEASWSSTDMYIPLKIATDAIFCNICILWNLGHSWIEVLGTMKKNLVPAFSMH